MHVFNRNGTYIDPDDWALKLPGSLVEVTFSLHHAFLDSSQTNAFNAHPIQIVVLKDGRSGQSTATLRRGITRPGPLARMSDTVDSGSSTIRSPVVTTEDASTAPAKKRKQDSGEFAVYAYDENRLRHLLADEDENTVSDVEGRATKRKKAAEGGELFVIRHHLVELDVHQILAPANL